MRAGFAVVATLLIGSSALAVGCSVDPARSDFNNKKDSGGGSSGFGSSNGGFDVDAGAQVDEDGCSAEARLVYVLSQESDLYSFTPNTATFRKIGRLNCNVDGLFSVPNSMAIDRSGTAWVNYSTGELFKVSTKDASCESTPFEPNQNANFTKFGMAFATNGEGSTEETLYISGLEELSGGGHGLGKIDLTTFKLTMLGDYSGDLAGKGAELTGTGDGRLFGFFTTSPATLAQIDKGKGSTTGDKSLTGVNTGNAWAFSFWGGDFWFYTSDGVTASEVTQLKASGNGEIAVAKADVGGFRIVGAGVSTCAPTTPPR